MGVEEGVVDVIIGSITTSGANDAHGHMEELPGERTPPHTHSLLESPQQRSINSAVGAWKVPTPPIRFESCISSHPWILNKLSCSVVL